MADRWINSLASLTQLQHVFVGPQERIEMYVEDLREFYHAFEVGDKRALRNTLALDFCPREVEHFASFPSHLRHAKRVAPALKTLAMGDNSAVALAQTAHLSVILRHSSLTLDRFLSLSGLGPRSGLVAGLLIDDFALFDRVPKNPQPPDDAGEQSQGSDLPQSAGARSIAEVRLAYEATGLSRHLKKAIAKASRADLWGGTVDGESGLVWPALGSAGCHFGLSHS